MEFDGDVALDATPPPPLTSRCAETQQGVR